MALSEKDIVITPNRGQSDDPVIAFSGANSTVNAQTISLRTYPISNGTLSFEGSAGQLFSITNDLTGSIFSVNDVSGIPSIDVAANGTVSLAPYGGKVGIGTSSPSYTLDVAGQVKSSQNFISTSTGPNITGQFSAVAGSTFTSFYNDGTNFYLLKHPSNTTNWDSSRPFIINLSSGVVTISSTGANTVIGGPLVYGGAALANSVTGTGSMVLSANPTLTGSLNLNSSNTTTSAILNITGGSSSGYGTIEVGGASGAFIDMKSPASDDYDIRMATTGSGGFIEGGPGGAIVYFLANGNVGVGTSAPAAPLVVVGTTLIGQNTTSQRLRLYDDGNPHIHATATPLWLNAEDGSAVYINNQYNGNVILTNGTGKVGIGNSTPASLLHITGGTSTDQFRLGHAGGNEYKIGRSTGDGLLYFYGTQASFTGYVFSGADGERMRVASNGNVGIGTASPTTKLYVAGGSILSDASIYASAGTGYVSLNAGNSTNPGYVAWYRPDNTTRIAYLGWATSGNTNLNMTLENGAIFNINGGNVGIGASSPSSLLHVSGALTYGGVTLANSVTGTGSMVLSTGPTFTGTATFNGNSSVLSSVLANAGETTNVTATAATGTINYDVATSSVVYFTSNATANWTVNFRASSGTTLNNMMAIGQTVTVAHLVTQGATAYYNSLIQVDGANTTAKWQGGTAPTAGNASGIDGYTYTIIKTANTTFTILASQTQFK